LTLPADYFSTFTTLYHSFLDDFQKHASDLELDMPRKLKAIKDRFVLLDLLSRRQMPQDNFDTLAQVILGVKRKNFDRILAVHLPSVASDSTSKATQSTLGRFKNWFWPTEEDLIQERELAKLFPWEIMKIFDAHCERITDSEFLSRLDDYTTRMPVLQQAALEAEEYARSHLAKLVTPTERLLHRARFCQQEVVNGRVQQEAIGKEAEELKTSRSQWMDKIAEASRAGPSSCVVQPAVLVLVSQSHLSPTLTVCGLESIKPALKYGQGLAFLNLPNLYIHVVPQSPIGCPVPRT
jgi:hypothetical protein